MKVGVPKEIKNLESRVALTPEGARAFTDAGHEVYVERGAGLDTSITDDEYSRAGAVVLERHEEIFEKADIVYKVKEPLPQEYQFLKEGKILFAYLHLAANRELTRVLLERAVTGVAFETIQLPDGHLPLLEPMSEIAGRLSIQEGAKYLECTYGGRGILLGGVPGVSKGNVVIIGGGSVGLNAATIAVGMGANVRILDIDKRRLQFFDSVFANRVQTLYSTPANIEGSLSNADLVICAVLIPGRRAPRLIRREHLKMMKRGAVIVDVAIDQGGCCETTRPTSHNAPTFIVDGIVHYCVDNMPAAVPVTSTRALAEATLPYALRIANKGLKEAAKEDGSLLKGINTFKGAITHPQVASSLGMSYTIISPEDL